MSWLLPAMDDRKTVSANVISSQELLHMVALLVLAALIGGFIRQSQAQAELHGLLQRQRENLEIAHALHDYISNDITDASLLLGQAQEGDFTRIADAMQCLDDASARSHELIVRLEPTQFSEKPPHDAISYATVPKRSSAAVSGEIMLNELRQTVSEKQANLTALGLDGIVLLPEMIPGSDDVVTEHLLLGLARELFRILPSMPTFILHTFLQLKFRVTSMRSGCAMPLPPNLPRFRMALVFLASATSLWNMEVNCLPAFKRKMRCAGGLWRRIFPEKPMYKALHFGFREIPGSASAFKPIPQSETI